MAEAAYLEAEKTNDAAKDKLKAAAVIAAFDAKIAAAFFAWTQHEAILLVKTVSQKVRLAEMSGLRHIRAVRTTYKLDRERSEAEAELRKAQARLAELTK